MWLGCLFVMLASAASAAPPDALRVGLAQHAFDHLDDINDQAATAADCGANIFYCSGVGVCGYQGLPPKIKFSEVRKESLDYIRKSKSEGIRLAIGYVCATSIVGLNTFDQNWPPEFRSQFHSSPADWRQVDKNDNPLPSWYGGQYQPACMNNPDWRTYEKNIVHWQLESGCDGIFFDNPTVHPDGCYCRFCMERFADFLAARPRTQNSNAPPNHDSVAALRQWAAQHPGDFMEFRSTIARDFLGEMRRYARTIKPNALATCNNSLNSPGVLFAQCRKYGYDINEMSKTEDFVLVEDMSSQPRVLSPGRFIEYGPTYDQLHAINHGKPIVAVTVAEADYHTPPNLVRLAMAEATAHNSSYLLWPTWPESVRQRMVSVIRPETAFLRQNKKLFSDTQPRRNVLLFLCFRRWLQTNHCVVSDLAAALSRANVPFAVASEDNLAQTLQSRDSRPQVLLIESFTALNDGETQAIEAFQRNGGRVMAADAHDWLMSLRQVIEKPSLTLEAPPGVRAIIRDQRNRTLVHLYNLNIQRISSFDDKVFPAKDIKLSVGVPKSRVHSVRALTADANGTSGPLAFTTHRDDKETVVETSVPNLEISEILVIE